MGANQSKPNPQREAYTAWHKNFENHYDGNVHWTPGARVQRPKLDPVPLKARMGEMQQSLEESAYQKQGYLNVWGENEHKKYPDVDTYYSSTKRYPRRLVVQATKAAHEDHRPRHWGRRKLEGKAPFIIRLSEFCLNPFALKTYDGSGYIDEDKQDERKSLGKENLARQIFFVIILSPLHWITSIILTMLLSWIIQLCLSVQIITSPWTDDNSAESYKDYENVHWNWPKHAINILDQSPNNRRPQSNVTKLTIPRLLVVWNPNKGEKGEWEAQDTTNLRDQTTGMLQPYIFLSFSRSNYPVDHKYLNEFFFRVAQKILDRENEEKAPGEPEVKAFWVDTECVSQSSKTEYTRDVNTICDAVRCAKRIYILLPDNNIDSKKLWGQRAWTLPEVLLAAEKIRYCITPCWRTGSDISGVYNVSLNDMYESFWPEKLPPLFQKTACKNHEEKHESAICHLVNHYTNRTKLSELQLFTLTIQALAQLASGLYEGYTTSHLAYAAMGLMSYRVTPDDSDNTFQAIARLSLVNDSNKVLERLLCLWPRPTGPSFNSDGEQKGDFANNIELLCNIADQDQYATHLWDIQPLCDVVGVGDDQYTPTVIVDRCRGIPIRWKSFPRLKYTKDTHDFRAQISGLVIYFGVLSLNIGFNLLTTISTLGFAAYGPSSVQNEHAQNQTTFTGQNVKWALVAVGIFLGSGWIISWLSPWAVRQLCSGGSQGVSCHLVGFEGILSLREIEKIIYGNYHRRLSFAPSGTPFSEKLRDTELRTGVEPKDPEFWNKERVRLQVPTTHRLFTIVDTGSLTVLVIAAERPPVVALICGREGGMLRTLLCSWRFENNTLYRECVIRMQSSLEEISSLNNWLKVSLASQGDVGRMRRTNWKPEESSHCASSTAPTPAPNQSFG